MISGDKAMTIGITVAFGLITPLTSLIHAFTYSPETVGFGSRKNVYGINDKEIAEMASNGLIPDKVIKNRDVALMLSIDPTEIRTFIDDLKKIPSKIPANVLLTIYNEINLIEDVQEKLARLIELLQIQGIALSIPPSIAAEADFKKYFVDPELDRILQLANVDARKRKSAYDYLVYIDFSQQVSLLSSLIVDSAFPKTTQNNVVGQSNNMRLNSFYRARVNRSKLASEIVGELNAAKANPILKPLVDLIPED
ncbi:unnamed protein product [Didymodactylos carnosus]|uniref:Uncharacterized protein n=1 Tax=Didymodactylos carnosus TaxID=1234261 RepID=A0A8S2CQX7_9BILA|nr:unnamed protein product [Didymodactylos carnosus]CAF3491912.1 unnamed protein product [Didymodactylos carnosus]